MTHSTDRIQKSIVLHAPPERVWRAISDPRELGSWFGAEFDDPFEPGSRVIARIVPTQVDAEVAQAQEPYRGLASEWLIESVEPMRRFSYRWHPYAVEPGQDYSSEPTSLVTFELEPANGGTRLTITESGFDQLPPERRAEAFERNDQGWAAQTRLIEKYLARANVR